MYIYIYICGGCLRVCPGIAVFPVINLFYSIAHAFSFCLFYR